MAILATPDEMRVSNNNRMSESHWPKKSPPRFPMIPSRHNWIASIYILVSIHFICVTSFGKMTGPGFFLPVSNHRQQCRERQGQRIGHWRPQGGLRDKDQQRIRKQGLVILQGQIDVDYDDSYIEDSDDLLPPLVDGIDVSLTRDEVEALTVPQLKQQLRLRGMKVTGRKQDLIERFLAVSSPSPSTTSSNGFDVSDEKKGPADAAWSSSSNDVGDEAELLSKDESKAAYSKAREFAKANGKELIDVKAFVDEEDQGKNVKSFGKATEKEQDDDSSSGTSGPEVWGSEAKIVEDYEGRSPVVDSLSRTVVEFLGSNQTMVKAYVVASRDALKPFLRGGANKTNNPKNRLREIQLQRENAAKRPVRFEEDEGLDGGDETGLYKDILHRDYSDWGEFTLTGAQLSAQEVQGVLLLSDVYGAFSEDTKALAEKIAFECQPIVVMVPDLFRGNPWKEDPSTPGLNEKGKTYETWRARQSDLRVSVDIRAAAACLRDQYGVSSVALWGMCYGGGRALEAAAGHLPGGNIFDVDGSVGPLPVDPVVAVAWYPTRYNASELFGPDRTTPRGDVERMAVMGVFAGNDDLPGATPDDASALKALLETDDRVKDHMIKVFPNQGHGFAHFGLSGMQQGDDADEMERFVDEEFGGAGRVSLLDGDAEVACLLTTAFMETYSRVFLPTTGPAITQETDEGKWNELEMIEGERRDIRKEIEDSLADFKDVPGGGIRVDPNKPEDQEKLKEVLRAMEPKDASGPYKILDDDDVQTMYSKLLASDDKFQMF